MVIAIKNMLEYKKVNFIRNITKKTSPRLAKNKHFRYKDRRHPF
jgi:hypothetical protein